MPLPKPMPMPRWMISPCHAEADADADADAATCRVPIPIANSRSDAEPLSDRMTCQEATSKELNHKLHSNAIGGWRDANEFGIIIASLAPRRAALRCANQITRIALREFCVRHVGPTGSYFLAKPTQFRV